MTSTSVHRRLLWSVYTPAMLLGVPAQASFVLLPLYVLDLGGSAAAAAAVIGSRGLGMMAMDIPAGMLAARVGEKAVMVVATVLIGAAFLGYALADSIGWFYAIAFLNGAGSSTFLLGRMAFLSATVTGGERGRVIALVAGSMRLAALLGPLAGGALAHAIGFAETFALCGLSILVGAVFIVLAAQTPQRQDEALVWHGMARLAREHLRVFATYGVAAITFMLMRAARTVLIPLAGAALGLDAPAIGIIVSISAAVDVALFYPAGIIMDRHGRRATAVPSSAMFATVLACLALVDSYGALLAVAIALGVANGLSTGIVMTYGTDLAPPARRGEFLGMWRLLTDFGSAAGPMLVSFVVAVAPLATAALAVASVGTLGSIVVYRYAHETLQSESGARS